MGFPRQEYWSRLSFPSPGDLPDSETEPWSLALQADSLPTEPPGRSQAIGFSNYSVAWFRVNAEHWPHFRPVQSKHRIISNTSAGTRLPVTVLAGPGFPATSLLFSGRKSMPRLPMPTCFLCLASHASSLCPWCLGALPPPRDLPNLAPYWLHHITKACSASSLGPLQTSHHTASRQVSWECKSSHSLSYLISIHGSLEFGDKGFTRTFKITNSAHLLWPSPTSHPGPQRPGDLFSLTLSPLPEMPPSTLPSRLLLNPQNPALTPVLQKLSLIFMSVSKVSDVL